MKSFRRILTLILAVAALAAFAGTAQAFVLTTTNQRLEIDGLLAHPVAYNIDDYNYFKLRDLAYLLRDGTARFSVDYDEATRTISLASGRDYKVIGGELEPLGRNPDGVTQSQQPLYINGKLASLTAYNISGYNFFKLRDLGELLGFEVGYDESRNMMLITTPAKAAVSNADIVFSTVDMDGNAWTDANFASGTLTMLNLWAYWCGPCVGEMPDLERISKEYADRGLRVIGLYDAAEESEDRQTLKDLGITYPNLRYVDAFDAYMNTGYYPTTIFVDNAGKVIDEPYIGSRSYDSWCDIVEGYLP